MAPESKGSRRWILVLVLGCVFVGALLQGRVLLVSPPPEPAPSRPAPKESPAALRLDRPTKLAPGPGGRVYVVDSEAGAVVSWDPATGKTDQVVGLMEGRPGGYAAPRGVAEGPDPDHVYVVEAMDPPLGGYVYLQNLADDTRVLVSVNGIRGEGPPLQRPAAMVRLPGGPLVVLDEADDHLLTVDPATGRRRVLSGGEAGAGPPFDELSDLVATPDGRLLALDGLAGVVVEVDPKSGDRRILADLKAGEGPVPADPRGLGEGPEGEVMVADAATGRVVAVSLASGARRLAVDPESGSGVLLSQARDAVASGGDIVVSCSHAGALVRVDGSGRRSVIAGSSLPEGQVAVSPMGGARSPGGRLVVCDVLHPSLLEVDLKAGSTRLLSGEGRGSGPELGIPMAMALSGEDKAYVTDLSRRILEVDLATGDRKLLFEYREGARLGDPTGLVPVPGGDLAVLDGVTGQAALLKPSGEVRILARDGSDDASYDGGLLDGGRLVVADRGRGRILAVDLRTGRVQEVSGGDRGEGPELTLPWGICLAPGGGLAVADSASRTLLRVHPKGDRELIAGRSRGGGPLPAPATSLVPLDEATVVAVCPGFPGLVQVALATGDRTPIILRRP